MARWCGRSFLVLLLAMMAAACAGRGAEDIVPGSPSSGVVLQNFILNQAGGAAWPLETMEIEASLPRLKKAGRMRVVRRVNPAGEADYDVLEMAGDSTVKRQVIARYLSADQRAAALPASSVALTPANYRFYYAGAVSFGDRLAYAFRIVPRKKREGLMNGMVWLDSATAVEVRESGYLAKNPSIFVKRVNVTRENELHDGNIAARTTHILAETLMGKCTARHRGAPGAGRRCRPRHGRRSAVTGAAFGTP
jgi:hypothetical protein